MKTYDEIFDALLNAWHEGGMLDLEKYQNDATYHALFYALAMTAANKLSKMQ